MYKKRIFVLLLVTILLGGCIKKNPEATIETQNDNKIIPITTPTAFKYSAGILPELSLEMLFTVKGKSEYVKMNMQAIAEQKGENLLWNISIPTIRVNDKTYSGKEPICKFIGLASPLGKFYKVQMSFPALENKGKTISPDNKIYKTIQKNILASMSSFRKDKIVSGDCLFFISTGLFKNLKPVDPSIKIGPKLVGYTYLNGKKVILTQTNYTDLEFLSTKGNKKITIDINGFSMLDAKTLFPVNGDSTVILKIENASPITIQTRVRPAEPEV